jgi:hypothetical protein
MLSKIYLGVGIFTCVCLGVMFAMKVTMPHLGLFDGWGSGRGGRSSGGVYYSSWGSGK